MRLYLSHHLTTFACICIWPWLTARPNTPWNSTSKLPPVVIQHNKRIHIIVYPHTNFAMPALPHKTHAHLVMSHSCTRTGWHTYQHVLRWVFFLHVLCVCRFRDHAQGWHCSNVHVLCPSRSARPTRVATRWLMHANFKWNNCTCSVLAAYLQRTCSVLVVYLQCTCSVIHVFCVSSLGN